MTRFVPSGRSRRFHARTATAALLAAASLGLVGSASAEQRELPPGHPPITPGATGDAQPAAPSLPPSSGAAPDAALPPGHPPIAQGAAGEARSPATGEPPSGEPMPDAALPPGHPAVMQGASGEAHAGAPSLPPSSGVVPDAALPAGTLRVVVLDEAGRPVARQAFRLLQTRETPAEGVESAELSATTNDAGEALFSGLGQASGTRYQAVLRATGSSAVFATPPFELPSGTGAEAKLYVFPLVTTRPRAFGGTAELLVETGNDTFTVLARFTFINSDSVAWVPSGVFLALPADASALESEVPLGAAGFRATEHGLELTGTVLPGLSTAWARFKLPTPSGSTFEFELPLPPNTVKLDVVAQEPPGARLAVTELDRGEAGATVAAPLPPALETSWNGIPVLVAERGLGPPIDAVRLTLSGLPVSGSLRPVAALAAAAVAVAGLLISSRKKRARSRAESAAEARAVLLGELVRLERAHRAGAIGPKTYRQTRQVLLDSVARLAVSGG